jgi:ribosomal protein S21
LKDKKRIEMKETNPEFAIIEVWNNNLEEAFRNIRKIVQKYKYVAMVSLKRK